MRRPRFGGFGPQSNIASGRASCEEKGEVHVSTNGPRDLRSFAAVGGLALMACGLPASAQSGIEGAAQANVDVPKNICELQAFDLEQDVAQELHAICGDRGLALGPVSEFSVLANDGLKAMLVDVQFQGDRRILLLSIGRDGLPMAENITGQLARAAGKGPMSDINDVTIELAGFVSNGAIAVHRKDGGEEGARAGPEIKQVSIGQQLMLEQARLSSSAGAAQ